MSYLHLFTSGLNVFHFMLKTNRLFFQDLSAHIVKTTTVSNWFVRLYTRQLSLSRNLHAFFANDSNIPPKASYKKINIVFVFYGHLVRKKRHNLLFGVRYYVTVVSISRCQYQWYRQWWRLKVSFGKLNWKKDGKEDDV